MADQTQAKIANELIRLAAALQPSISSDGRTLKIKPKGGREVEIRLLRGTVIQVQTPRFR